MAAPDFGAPAEYTEGPTALTVLGSPTDLFSRSPPVSDPTPVPTIDLCLSQPYSLGCRLPPSRPPCSRRASVPARDASSVPSTSG